MAVETISPGLQQAMEQIDSLVTDLTSHPQPGPVRVPENETKNRGTKIREFVDLWNGINDTVILSRHGGLGNDFKALTDRNKLIGDFTRSYEKSVDSHTFGRNMRRAIAIMKEDPFETIPAEALYPLLRPLGISRD
jgi:hypothetical protein